VVVTVTKKLDLGNLMSLIFLFTTFESMKKKELDLILLEIQLKKHQKDIYHLENLNHQ
jgi:hypothetical protein